MLLLVGAILTALSASAARRSGVRVSAVPAAGRVARAGGARAAGVVRGRALLGAPGAGLRRPAGDDRAARLGTRCTRRKSHGTHIHGRSLRRLPVRGARARRSGQPGSFALARRWAEAE